MNFVQFLKTSIGIEVSSKKKVSESVYIAPLLCNVSERSPDYERNTKRALLEASNKNCRMLYSSLPNCFLAN